VSWPPNSWPPTAGRQQLEEQMRALVVREGFDVFETLSLRSIREKLAAHMARNVDAHKKAIRAIALKIIRDSMLEIGRPAAKRKKPEPKRKNNVLSKPRKRPAVAAAAVAEPKPLLEKMVAATCAGEAGEPSKADTRQLLALLREGKAEARSAKRIATCPATPQGWR
jgi:hypothetical protein